MPERENEEPEEEFLRCSQTNFEEKPAFMKLLASLPGLSRSDPTERDKAVKSLCVILEKYQEQPQILDLHLEEILEVQMDTLKAQLKSRTDDGLLASECRLLYVLTKVRGSKAVVKFLSHEAAELEPLLLLLESLDPADFEWWECRYVVLIWLSLVVRVPFDLSRIDPFFETSQSIILRLQNVCKAFLQSSGKERDAAGEVLARLYSRKDMLKELDAFLLWINSISSQSTSGGHTFQMIGVLRTMCCVFEYAPREILADISRDSCVFLQKIVGDSRLKGNTLIRKLTMKLAQRTALSYLKPKVAKWRYSLGNRLLKTKFTVSSSQKQQSPDTLDDQEEEEEVAEQLEELMDILLNGIRDKDTIVRWSASKGIGRITERLPKEFATDVLDSVIGIFAENTFLNTAKLLDISAVDENAWHGACLSVAELARRGLLLPNRLPQVVSWIVKALTFDKQKSTYSVGANVRDAACYVCWSFARAYSSEIMKPYVDDLAPHLITVAVYDREVNVRRAASAAFQENVGRQGVFPHGIEIVTEADYFAVGNRTNSFVETSLLVARFKEYRFQFIDHLIEWKCVHWDPEVRELAAVTLKRLANSEPRYLFDRCCDTLIPGARSSEVNVRHGSVRALSEIISSWSDNAIDFESYKPAIAEITDLPIYYLNSKPEFITSFGSEIFLKAVCRLVGSLCSCTWALDGSLEEGYMRLLQVALLHQDFDVQNFAALSISAFDSKFKLSATVLSSFVDNLDSRKDAATRRGYALALKSIAASSAKLAADNRVVFEKLVDATTVKNDPQIRNDAAARQYACELIGQLCMYQPSPPVEDIINCLLIAMDDYAVDSRGDVGSWVREAAMLSLEGIAKFSSENLKHIDECIWTHVMSKCIRQALERIDRVRKVAGQVIVSILGLNHLTFTNRKELHSLLFNAPINNWGVSAEVFPVLANVLEYPAYRIDAILGLTSSVGSLTESLASPASAALMEVIESLPRNSLTMDSFLECTLQIMDMHHKNERVIGPIFDTLNQILSLQYLDDASPELRMRLLKNVRRECFKSKDVKKLIKGIAVISAMFATENQDISQQSRDYLLGYLGHPYPRVRKSTAEQFYLALASMPERCNNYEPIELILLETTWDKKLDELVQQRAELKRLLSK